MGINRKVFIEFVTLTFHWKGLMHSNMDVDDKFLTAPTVEVSDQSDPPLQIAPENMITIIQLNNAASLVII